MIGIRSITYHLPEKFDRRHLDLALKMSYKWSRFDPYVRTQRIVLTPQTEARSLSDYAWISHMCDASDIRWFNVPIDPWNSKNRDGLFKFAENILASYGRAFVNVLTFQNGKLDQDILERSGMLVKKTAQMSNNGKDNFRLGLSANIEANGAFFPFTYSGGVLGFSIALELTQELNRICFEYPDKSMMELQEIILERLSEEILRISVEANRKSEEHGIEFFGFDFSIAPIISSKGSVVPLVQRLGVYNFGKTGTLFATAYWTSILKALSRRFKAVGFSGVMYSLLEDLELCMINNQRGIALDDLIKVSSMCGCGVDMVPVPFDISLSELKVIFTEVYAVSTRLNKPLGIRILPIPHVHRMQTGYTNLNDDADFIANTKVLTPDVNLFNNFGNEFLFCK